jgi:hypothetical protein
MAEAISRYESRELLVLPEDVAEAALSRQACDMAEEATEKHIFAAFGLKPLFIPWRSSQRWSAAPPKIEVFRNL